MEKRKIYLSSVFDQMFEVDVNDLYGFVAFKNSISMIYLIVRLKGLPNNCTVAVKNHLS